MLKCKNGYTYLFFSLQKVSNCQVMQGHVPNQLESAGLQWAWDGDWRLTSTFWIATFSFSYISCYKFCKSSHLRFWNDNILQDTFLPNKNRNRQKCCFGLSVELAAWQEMPEFCMKVFLGSFFICSLNRGCIFCINLSIKY